MVAYGFCFQPVLHRDDCSGYLHLWVEDSRGDTATVPTSYDVAYDEWDPVSGWLVLSESSGQRLSQLRHYARCMEQDLDTLENVIAELYASGRCRASRVIDRLNHETAIV